MGVKNTQADKDALIADLKALIDKHQNVTRDFYRSQGAFSEHTWGKFFPTFKDFVAAASINIPNEVESEKHSFTEDSWEISLPSTRIHTLDELLEYCKVDLQIWEVERFIVNKWELGRKDRQVNLSYNDGKAEGYVLDSGKVNVEPLFQVKATLVKRKEIVNARIEIEKLKEDLKKSSPYVSRSYSVRDYSSGNMLEVNISDAHFGKMAWGKETGSRNYDTPIAASTFLRAVANLINLARVYTYDKIVFVVGNDLLNSDDEMGRTTKGTFVSTDGRYQKTFSTVRQTVTRAIHMLAELAPVEVVMVPGNHDNLSVWHLGDSLECLFENDQNVTVRNEPTQRKYIRFGDVFLLVTHGDKGKREDYPLLMATERSKDFGETKYREVHTGHIHQTKLQEWHGVRVRIIPSLSPPDAWHSENGFTGQQRNAEAYVWNEKHGLVTIFYHNDDSYPEIETDRIIREK
jgi:hypothetical protein